MRLGGSSVCMVAMALSMGFSAPAIAQADGFGGALFSAIGLTAPERPAIEYRDRPPLVVPPRSTLPAPQDAETRRNSVNWPNDPNSTRSRESRAATQAALAEEKIRRGDTQARLSGEELTRIRARGNRASFDAYDQQAGSIHYTPMQMMREADTRRATQAEMPLGVEPPRRSLTDPPTGLRAATQRVRAEREAPADSIADKRDGGARDFATRGR
jgi:hypothetical protein